MKTENINFFVNDEAIRIKAISKKEIKEVHEQNNFHDEDTSVENTEKRLTHTKAIQAFDDRVVCIRLISPGHPSIYEGYTKSGEFIRQYTLHETY